MGDMKRLHMNVEQVLQNNRPAGFLTNEQLLILNDKAAGCAKQYLVPGVKFIGSVNMASLFYIKGTLEWYLFERLYYYRICETFVVTDREGVIIELRNKAGVI